MKENTPSAGPWLRPDWRQSASIGVLALTLVACGGTRENDEPVLSQGALDLAIQQLTDASMVASVTQMANATDALSTQVSGFCNAPDAAGLTQLQNQWQRTSTAWQQLLPYNFGPLNDNLIFPPYQFIDSYRPRGRDSTATVRTSINGWLVSDDNLTTEFFTGQTFNRVGLLALELVLFETSDDQNTTTAAILTEYQNQSRKCGVLAGLTGALKQRTDSFRDGWTVTYQETGQSYREQFLSGALADGSTPLETLLPSIQDYLNYLKQRDVVNNIAQIAASDGFDSWTLMTAATDSIESLLTGVTEEQVSLFDLMNAGGNGTAVATIKANLQQARDAISSRDSVSFNAAMAALDGNFKREIPDSLDVSLGINFSDGD